MTEEQVRAIVRNEVESELLREGGLADHCRSASLHALMDILNCEVRTLCANLRDEIGLDRKFN